MKAFICIYRHIAPGESELKKIHTAAGSRPELNEFIEKYFEVHNYYDWGDDPSFFAAGKFNGHEKFATWGVCRSNVRKQLQKGDLIIFICGKQKQQHWEYFFIGFGTVMETILNRIKIWSEDRYAGYRSYFNLLIDSCNKWKEPFGGRHKDWENRKKSPYIIFETNQRLSNFNIHTPIKIAKFNPLKSNFEQWNTDDPLVKELHSCLFERYFINGRNLRTRHPQRPHQHIRLNNVSSDVIKELRNQLYNIATKGKIDTLQL